MQPAHKLYSLLAKFAEENFVKGKGPLSTVLILTRMASKLSVPLSPDSFLTGKKGQVAGLSGSAVKSILKEHGIERVLSEEGGRTSRGSMALMRAYVSFLNKIARQAKIDYVAIELWWIEQVKAYFAAQPIKVKADVSASLRQIVADLLELALERQRKSGGTMVVGAVLEHLVGAKLSLALPRAKVEHKCFSAADASVQAKGDFLIGDTAIHVTVAPSDALIRKCRRNLQEGLRPLIVTTEAGTGGVKALADNEGISERIDVLEISQFLATNVYEWIGFQNQDRSGSLGKLVEAYNGIVDECETDPSLKISLG